VTQDGQEEKFNPEDDRNASNVLVRAGYLRAMAMKAPAKSDDRLFLLQAARSLMAYAASLRGVAGNGWDNAHVGAFAFQTEDEDPLTDDELLEKQNAR
jgi:hypothetical protein